MTQLEQFGGIAGVLLMIGWFLKEKTPVNNKWIPIVLVASGVLVQCACSGWTGSNAISGALAALAATGFHSGSRNLKQGITDDKNEPPTQDEPPKH